ncbi:MAG: MFS transporter [Kiritimatiellae bacterium]|jgi:EmrB/QacA subfamily drug resistance transporter|nr:MFS transporter [Kiritimatiellia bacterium]
MVTAKTSEKQPAKDTSTTPSMKFLNIETKWLVLLAIGLGTFMSALDASIVNAILPVLADIFHTGVASIEWVVTVYLLVVSGLLLTVGRLGDLHGNKKTYITGFFIFLIGSLSAGFSPSEAYLIGSRGLQAIGAAMLFANAPAILTKVFPAIQRGQALGLQGTMTYLGLSTGPFLGGWLADHLSWHFVFFINVPIGLFAIWLSLKVIPNDRPEKSREPFDLAGALTFMIGLTTLLFALNKGESLGWTSLPILSMMVTSFLILSLFIWIEGHVKTPMLDLSLFKRKIFAISTVSPILNYMCIYSVLFLMPFYLIHGRGLSASHAGLILTAQPIVMALTAPFSGSLSDRVGSRLLTTLGMLILAAGLFLLGNASSQTHLGIIVVGLAISGLGVGLFVSPNNSSLMGDAPRNRQGIASGILALGRNVGMVLGIGLTGAIFTTYLNLGNPKDPVIIIHAFDMGLRFACGLALLAAVITSLRGNDHPSKKESV